MIPTLSFGNKRTDVRCANIDCASLYAAANVDARDMVAQNVQAVVVQAQVFKGDGSQLTNIQAVTNPSDVVTPGNVTAAGDIVASGNITARGAMISEGSLVAGPTTTGALYPASIQTTGAVSAGPAWFANVTAQGQVTTANLLATQRSTLTNVTIHGNLTFPQNSFVQYSAYNPGIMMQKAYTDPHDRYGIGQFEGGLMRMYAANGASASLSLAVGGNTYWDAVSAKYNETTIRNALSVLGSANINATLTAQRGNFSGQVDATSFYGDGSNLLNVGGGTFSSTVTAPSANINGQVNALSVYTPGTVQAFEGNFTQLDATSVHASGNVTAQGQVTSATLFASGNVTAQGQVTTTTMFVSDNLEANGQATFAGGKVTISSSGINVTGASLYVDGVSLTNPSGEPMPGVYGTGYFSKVGQVELLDEAAHHIADTEISSAVCFGGRLDVYVGNAQTGRFGWAQLNVSKAQGALQIAPVMVYRNTQLNALSVTLGTSTSISVLTDAGCAVTWKFDGAGFRP